MRWMARKSRPTKNSKPRYVNMNPEMRSTYKRCVGQETLKKLPSLALGKPRE